MLQEIAAAIHREDYRAAAQLLKPLLKTRKDDLWVQFYVGRVQEGMGKRNAAEQLYLKLLPQTSNPKLMAQIRQGIQRIEQQYNHDQETAIADAVKTPTGQQTAVLILEPIVPAGIQDGMGAGAAATDHKKMAEYKKLAAQAFGKVFNLDAYSARLQLPSRGWRLYRSGPLGELDYYVQALRQVNVPSFAIALAQIAQLKVFTIHYFKTLLPQPQVRCVNTKGQAGMLRFDWSAVTGRVMGRIPLFESVVTLDAKRRLQRKTQTQDYVPFCDLHLPSEGCILRLAERSYEFNQGIALVPETRSPIERDTVSQSWLYLMEQLAEPLQTVPIYAEFDPFANTVIDWRELLGGIEHHISLERRQPSLWDGAFHLYSGLAYWRSQM
ncbi:MAG: tetratricopeptide repeat protein [Cyanobacteria bacterium P01_G01_bin.54]